MSPQKKHKSTPPESGADHIGALPDGILHHVLSFLPAQEAVQTCSPGGGATSGGPPQACAIVGLDDEEELNVKDLRKVVDHLLILRERTNLDTVETKFSCFREKDEPYVETWVRFAMMSKVRVLTLHISGSKYFYLKDLPLVSRHLSTLDLHCVGLEKNVLNFASCPALEDLKMNKCYINTAKILSRSLKHLTISGCRSDMDSRLDVSTPGLVSLELDDFFGRTPFLENMALLETAYVNLGKRCSDVCLSYDSGVFCGANNNPCQNCVPIEDDCSRECVLLGGISRAKHLKLLSESRQFIFTRDLRHCPTFSKLKTLLLSECWCEAPDLDPLACILKNSAVLEKLILQLYSEGPNHEVETKGRYIPMEPEVPSAVSKHLNIVEVKCNVVDKRILKVLKFLSAFNICFSF